MGTTGYGQFDVHDRPIKAHRVAFLIAHGRWPEPCGLHHCDNRACVNPDHLFEGDKHANMRDCAEKKRTVYQRSPWKKRFGAAHCRARFSDEEAADIRARYARGELMKDIARELDADEGTISNIIRGRTYVTKI
jgi:hypothetical protein